MKSLVVLSLYSLLAAAAMVRAEHDALTVVQSEPARVTIEQQPAGRRLLRLPGIEFPLRIAPVCAPGLTIDSLSINIADTRRIFRSADFDDQPAIETTLYVPGRQIGPMAVAKFCIADAPADDRHSGVSVADAYTANVSLRCVSDTQQSVAYETLALQVILLCGVPGSSKADKDQDASSSMTRF